MIIGVLGDTHGRVEAMTSAMKVLAEAKAEYFIHTGDVCADAILDHLAGLASAFVFGNNDWDRASMTRYAQQIGVACYGNFADLTLDGKRVAVIHGDDYLFQGHTHLRKEERVGKTHVINPGALHRTPQKSVATVDTATGKVRFHFIT
jgi:putative phosphoesterase